LQNLRVYTNEVTWNPDWKIRFTKREQTMKKAILAFALVAGLSSVAMAADFKGYIIDQKCAAKAGMRGNVDCATACMKGGSPAVLVTDAGKIYKLDDQAKVVPLAGKQVTVTGKMTGDTITVASVKE
jgi:hypothetical protein